MKKNCPINKKFGKGLGKGVGGPGRGKEKGKRTPIDNKDDSKCGCGLTRKERINQRTKNRTKGIGKKTKKSNNLSLNQIKKSAIKIASKNRLNLDNLLIANFGQFCIIADKLTNKSWRIALKNRISQQIEENEDIFDDEENEFKGSSFVDTSELEQYVSPKSNIDDIDYFDESNIMPQDEDPDVDTVSLKGLTESDIFIDEHELNEIIKDKKFNKLSLEAKRAIKKIGSAIKTYRDIIMVFSGKVYRNQRILEYYGSEVVDDVIKDKSDLEAEIKIYNDLNLRYARAIKKLKLVAYDIFDLALSGKSLNWIQKANRAIEQAAVIKDTEIIEENTEDEDEETPSTPQKRRWEDRGDTGELKSQQGKFNIYRW